MNNNMAFILEDNPHRLPVFRDFSEKNDCILRVYTDVKDAIDMYLSIDPKYVFLDHDLDGKTYVNSEEANTGYRFAEWLKDNDPEINKRVIIIHSMNIVGAERMNNLLPSAVRVPFIYLQQFFNSTDL